MKNEDFRIVGRAPKPWEKPVRRYSRDTAGGKPVVVREKPGRNDQCPCRSGKKYKKCHG